MKPNPANRFVSYSCIIHQRVGIDDPRTTPNILRVRTPGPRGLLAPGSNLFPKQFSEVSRPRAGRGRPQQDDDSRLDGLGGAKAIAAVGQPSPNESLKPLEFRSRPGVNSTAPTDTETKGAAPRACGLDAGGRATALFGNGPARRGMVRGADPAGMEGGSCRFVRHGGADRHFISGRLDGNQLDDRPVARPLQSSKGRSSRQNLSTARGHHFSYSGFLNNSPKETLAVSFRPTAVVVSLAETLEPCRAAIRPASRVSLSQTDRRKLRRGEYGNRIRRGGGRAFGRDCPQALHLFDDLQIAESNRWFTQNLLAAASGCRPVAFFFPRLTRGRGSFSTEVF